jgi:N-acetylglucosaminyldiphosphoundecaprenol N-acetyl-beta-D-mannosaminyltransferase
MQGMLERERNRVHGFIGGLPGRAEAICERFGVRGVCLSPPMRPFSADHALEDWREFLQRCGGDQPPAIVWIGLGAPKQEFWATTVSRAVPGVMFFAVGAAFDFLSGTLSRAPGIVQKAGLEWAYRLGRDPRRLWRRYLTTNARFLGLALKELFTSDGRAAGRDGR